MFLPPEDSEDDVPRIHTIIQLSPQAEGSSHPPEPYFPSVLSYSWTIHAERGSTTHVPLQVQTVKQRRYPRANCTKTTFMITRPTRRSNLQESASYEVVHLLFESWPAKSVPNSETHEALRELMNVAYHVNKRPQYTNNELAGDPPIVLTCAEGGRTGTFIALSSLLRSFRCIQSPYDDTHIAPRVPPSPLSPPSSEIALDPVLREIDHLLDQRMNMMDNENQVCYMLHSQFNTS
jgi:protein-tyrosine phosphatase